MSDQVVELSQQSIAKGSKSFAAAARLFAPATRDDCVMLYAWCRHCDDVIDGQELGHDQQADYRQGQLSRLEQLRTSTSKALVEGKADDPIFMALARVAKANAIPPVYPQQLLQGFEMDVAGRSYATVDDTLDYGYHVAGVVGVMMAMIMGTRDPQVLDRASDLGIAFQLTNIARDVIDDARSGRVYLPADLLRVHGISRIDPDDRSQWPRLHAVALRLLDIAEPYYASALAGLPALPLRSAWAIGAARRVYREIGEKLRRGGPDAWAQRVSTTRAEKARLLMAGLGDALASRVAPGTATRAGLYDRPRPAQ